MTNNSTLKNRLSDVDKMIGSAIRAHRLRAGMSQEYVAEKLGISFQQHQKYEKGENRVAASTLREICSILGCEVTDIIPAIGVSTHDHAEISAEGLKAQAIIEAMSPAQRQAALRVLRAMEASRE